MIHDAAGNLYGTTLGGTYGHGTVFRLDTQGNLTSLYNFMGGTDGDTPFGGLARDAKGNLYGTTLYGGANSCGNYNCGTVFKIDAQGVESILYSFGGFTKGDGELPECDVIEDMAGNIYGATSSSQSAAYLFKINQAGQETNLYNFGGDFPGRHMVRDSSGNFYGAIGAGGAYNAGGVFKFDSNGVYTLLYSFNGPTDGEGPWDGVVRDAAGNLYGTTSEGGPWPHLGTVFELTFP
ncbi:MAG TPA: choice-of-anchor tandem repeat GloVer-containing protein [Candidatus Sulfotelmatobacter sp.]